MGGTKQLTQVAVISLLSGIYELVRVTNMVTHSTVLTLLWSPQLSKVKTHAATYQRCSVTSQSSNTSLLEAQKSQNRRFSILKGTKTLVYAFCLNTSCQLTSLFNLRSLIFSLTLFAALFTLISYFSMRIQLFI
jgi:hypothetical protein